MFYTIYKTTNKLNGKFYIGKHKTKIVDDRYLGSGTALKRAIQKYGKENFTKEVLFVFTNEEEMNNKERELVILNEHSYNVAVGGRGGFEYINRMGINKGANNVMVKSPITKTQHTLAVKMTKQKDPERYKKVSLKNLEKAVAKNIGAKRPDHTLLMQKIKKTHWEQQREQILDSLNSTYEVTSPDGVITQTNRLGDFCKHNNLTYVSMWRSSKVNRPLKRGRCRGWICRKI